MSKPTTTPVLFPRTLAQLSRRVFAVFCLLLLVTTVILYTRGGTPERAYAATTSNLNFQARLLGTAGAIVPDGSYNVQFKLYSVDTGGAALWTETYYDSNGGTPGNDNRVTVRSGYLSVHLGSQTAFPGTINWDEELWLTMNIGGTTQTATPTWDGEMDPRLKLTAVPYAFKAGQAAAVKTADTNAASTNSAAVSIASGNASGSTSNSGNITIDAGTATQTTGQLLFGTTNASALTLGRAGITTTLQGSVALTGAGTALNVTNNATIGGTLGVTGVSTLSGGLTVGVGTNFINQGSTLFSAAAISDVAAGGNIGTAAATVDAYTTFNVNQTTAGQTLTLPAPTTTTSGRMVFVNNVGSASFTMYGSVIAAGKSNAFIWNGTAWVTTVSLSGSVVNTIGTLDSVSKSADGAVISSNAIYLQTADATYPGLVSTGTQTFAGAKTFTGDLTVQDVTLAAGKSLTVTGGNTASRPGSPTEGMVYYDTTTKQLLVYANGKWQADRSTATKIVGTSASGGASGAVASMGYDGADYVNSSDTSAQIAINAALATVGNAGGGSVYLMEGTYIIDGAISIPNNVTLAGSGAGTVIKFKNGINADFSGIVNGDTAAGTRVVIRDFRIDGNKSNQSAGTHYGVDFDHMGSGNGTTAIDGGRIIGLYIQNMRNTGIRLSASSNNVITGNTVQNATYSGLYLFASSNNNTVTDNVFQGDGYGLRLQSVADNTIIGNVIQGNNTHGVWLNSSQSNVLSGNRIYDNGGSGNNSGIYIENSDRNTVMANDITDTSATTTNYAINILDSTSDNNYLADNRFSSTPGTSTINDAGTGTVYANQARAENGGQLTVRTADSTAAFQVQNAAGTGLLTVDTTNGQTVLRGVQDTPTLGSELVTSQDFSNATYWTCSTGWTTTTTTAQHNTGNTNTCAATNSNFTVTAGTRYEITYTVTGRTAGVVIPSIGGVSGSGTAADGNYTAGLTASTTGQLTFTPNSAFDGIISAVSVKTSTGTSRPTLIVKDQSGTDSLQLRVSTTNFGLGMNSLQYNTSGINNTALGNSSLLSNTTGYSNTASGYLGLRSNTTGYHNTATGVSSLFSNTTGYQNTAMGANSLFSNTTGYLNDASGYNSLYSNTTGFQNTASGAYAMQSNTSGYLNSAFGAAALQNNTSGYHNVAVGYLSLYSNTSGYYNTAIGYDAGYHDPAQGQFITLNNLQSSTMIGTGSQAYASNVLSLGGQGNMAASVGINTGLPANRLSAESFRYRTGSVTTDGTANIVGTGTTFTSDMVGNIIYIATNSASTAPYRRTITAFTDATHITVDSTVPALTNAEYYINYIGLQMSTTGNVGVGTLNPQSQFEVKGNAGVSSGAVTMTASSGNNTFTTSSSMTLNAGDYIIPTTTTGQARTVSTTATGTSFSIVGTFTGNVTGETFTIYHPTQTTTDSSGNTQFMIQGSTGNVSIGGIFATTTANVKLYVSGGSFLAGSIYTNGNIYNGSSTSNAQITPGTTGTTISRNVADANVALTVTQSNASSTGNILELKNSGGTVAGFSQAGNLFVGTTSAANKVNVNALTTADSLAQVAISTGATTNKGLVVQGVAGQSASYFEVQNSAGTAVAGVNGSANLYSTNGIYTSGSSLHPNFNGTNSRGALMVRTGTTGASTDRGLAIQAGSASQIADLIQLQDVNGSILSGFNANGGLYTYGTNNTFAGLATPAFTTVSTGSSYYYVMTATNAAGETIASASLGMANNTSTLQWNQVNGATGYKIYRNTSNSFTAGSLLLTTITNGTTVSYTDTGSATGAGLPPTVPTGTGLVVKGWASQSANIFEIQNGNTGLVAAGITSYGRGFFGSTSPVSVGGGNAATLSVTPTATTNVGIVVQGQASQTNNLLQLQDSNGLVNSSFNALGNQLTLGRIASSGTVTQGKIVLADGTTSNYGLTLQSATLTNNQTITFPNETGTVCTTGSVCTGYAPSATNGYVQLAPAAAQTDATTNSSIFLNKTGASGNILQLQKNATDVLTVSNTGSVALQNSADSTAALSVKNLAGTSLLTVDTTNGQTVLRGVQDTPTLGSELVTSQDFSNATYWTCSTGWTTTTTTAQHNTGNTNTCAATNSNFTVTAGTRYEITWTVTGDTSGGYTVAPSIGGTAGTSRAGNGTFTSGITAANTNSLTFTPASPWNGTISAISVKVSTSIGKPQLTVKDQSGADAFQLRATSTNLGLGLSSLQYTTTGAYNTALGINSLYANTTGFSNTASGYQSLYANTTGFSNTASGYQSLYANTTGVRNTASGSQSLYSNTTGSSSVASGDRSLYANTTGTANTAAGASSLISNSSGSYNVAFGYQASYFTATGSNNTAVGTNAMFKNTTGSYNTSIGSGAGYTGSQIQFTTLRNLQGSTMLGLNSQAFASGILALGGQGADAISVGINTGLPANRLSAESYRYSTGSVTTDGTANIVGTGTTFTSDMVGNVIYIATNSDTTAPYRRTITAFTDATHITVDSTVPALTDAQYYINYIGLQMSTTGNVGINTLSPANKLNVNTLTTADSLAQVAISTGATTNKGLVVQGVASQTANLLEAQNSTGSIIARIQSDGSFVTSTSYTGPLFKGTDSSAADTSNITVRSGAITSGAYNTGNLTLQSGNAISGTTGNVLVDAGSTSGTTGSVLLGTSNASAITLGRSGITTTNAGALTVAQLLTGQLGATISGAAISLNDSSNFNTSINGGTSTGTVTIGNSAAGAIAIQSASTVGITGTTTITGLSAGAGTALTVNNSTSTGSIFVAQDNGSAVFTIADGGNVTLAAGKSLTVTGGNTASRPGSPTEGMVYYDTTTKQLLTYSNGKWQSDSKAATFVVAASDSTQADKDGAQYVANGEDSSGSGIGALDGDQIEINAALDAAEAAKGGVVFLAAGTYTVDAPIQVPNNVTLAGTGASTLIQLGNFGGTAVNTQVVTNKDTSAGTRMVVRDIRIDGRRSVNTNGTQYGIYLNNMGAGNGSSARDGAKISNVYVANMRSRGIHLNASSNNTISGSTMFNNVSSGIRLDSTSNNNTITGNLAQGNGTHGIYLITSSSNNTITGNTMQGNSNSGIRLESSSNSNVVSGNKIYDNGGATTNDSVYVTGADNNTIVGNDINDTSATTNNYAINVFDNTSDNNYLADNRFSSTPGTSTINDAGTGTIYANQSRAEYGGQLTNRTANSTSAFAIQNASGTDQLVVDSTNSKLLVVGTIDTTTATTLAVGTATATAVSISRTGIITTVNGALTVAEATNLNGDTTIGNATTDRLTVTSQIQGGSPLVFQGATDNGFTTTFAIIDPTGNNTITFPNETGTVCTTGSVCTGYAPSATNGYVQLAPAGVQADGTTNSSIFINKTSTGNLLQLQQGAADKFVVDNSGNLTVVGTYNTNTFTSSALTFGAAAQASVQSTSGQTLLLQAQGAAALKLRTNGGNDSSGLTVNSTGLVGIATASPAARLQVSGSVSGGVPGTGGAFLRVEALSITDSSTAASGTTTNYNASSFGQSTLAATNTNVTTTNSATLYLQGATKAGSNQAITNSYGLQIDTASVAGGNGVTNAYGLSVQAPTGATNNYAAIFQGGSVGIGTTAPQSQFEVKAPAGTTSGAITMTASNGAGSFTTSSSMTLNRGDYIVPTTTTGQAVYVTTTATGTSFTVHTPFTANVTAETFTIYHPTANFTNNSGTSQLSVLGNGNVSIGDYLAGAVASNLKLSVNGAVALNGNVWAPSLSNSNSTSNAYLQLNTTGSVISRNVADANSALTVSQLHASSTGNILELNNSGGTVAGFSQAGNLFVGTTSAANKVNVNALTTADSLAQVAISTGATTNKGLVIQGVASQTADLFQVQDSTGAVKGGFTYNGNVFVDSTLTTRSTSSGSSNSNTLVIKSGNATGATSSSGDVTIDAGTATGTAGSITLGATNASAITLGRSGITTTNAGALTVAQLLTGQLGATISGAAISLNDSSNFNTSINGGTSTGTVTIGNSAAGAIAIQSASTVGITGTTTVTGLSAGAGTALTVNNSTSTGSIFVAQDNGSAVFTIADGGAITATQTLTVQGTSALTLGLTGTNTGSISFKGATAASGTINLVGQANPTGTRTITLPDETGTVCTTGSVCTGYAAAPASGSYLQQVPATSAANTVTPTANSVVGLTVNGTSGTAATALAVSQPGAAAGVTITSANNTATNGLSFSGTFTNLISAPNFSVTNAGAVSASGLINGLSLTQDYIQFQNGGAGLKFLETSGSGSGTTNSLSVLTGASGGAGASSGDITIGTGNGTGTGTDSGDISIDVGTATGTAGTIYLGTGNTAGITLGRSGITTTNAGALTVSQLLTGNLGATISGATTSINASSNFATNINTGTSTGAVSIGNGAAGVIALQSGAAINITAGAASAWSTGANTLTITSSNFNTTATGINGTAIGATTASTGAFTTLGSTGATTLGNNSSTVAVDSSNWDVSSAGAISGLTGYSQASGNFLQSGAGTFGTGTGTVSLNGDTDVAANKALSTKVGTTFTTAGTIADDTSLGGGSFYLLDTSGAAQVFNSIAAGRDGQYLTLTNVDATNAVTLTNNGSGTNKIITGTGGNITVPVGGSVQLVFDSANARWRVVGTSAVTGGFANQQLSNLSGTVAVNASLNPNADNTLDLGSAANSWRTVYADTSVLTPTVDVAAAGTLSLGTTTATAITLGRTGITTTNAGALTVAQLLTGQLGATISGAAISLNDSSNFNTSINGGTSTGTVTIGNSAAGAIAIQSASTVGITGTTTITGLTSGDALTVNNSTSTGSILVAQDNGTAVMTIADGGAATFKNQTDSTSGFAVQDKDGNSRLVVDTTGDRVDVSGAYLRVTGTTTSSVAVQLNQSNFTIQSSAATSQYAVQNQAKFDLLNTGASLSALYGMMNVPTITTTAGTSTTIAAVYGEYLRIDKTSSSVSITGQYGLRVDDGNDVNVTNKYGIYVDEATSATASILFSLYVDGSTGSYFGVKGDGLVDSRSDSTTGFQILNSGTSAVVLNVDTTNTRLGIGTSAPSTSLAFGAGADRTIGVEARSSNAAGRALTISAGAAGTGGSAFTGGLLTLQGGAAAGTGNANGGNVLLTGGAGTGTGVKGLVVIDTPTFTTASTQNCAVDCTIIQANVDANAAVIINATAASLTVTMPDPTITTAGRVVYVTAANGSNDFSLSVNGGGSGNVISMRQNTTATMIWNGSDWTAAGASSSTTLQAAYDNTLSSAGGAEIVLNNTATSNGLTVRNNASSPIIGGIFEVQTSIGSNLLSVNNNATEYATNGGAETAGASASTFPANTWDTTTGGTVDRWTTAGDNIATGAASVRVQTTTTNHGARNRISTSLTSGLTYAVSFAVRGATNFGTLQVLYSPDGTTTGTTQCATAQTATSGIWTRISCTFVASGSINSSNSILIRQTDATARTFYLDNLSINISASATYAADGSVDDSGAFATNWTAYGTGSTATRDTGVLYDTSASARGDTTNNSDRGIRNNLAITPAVSTQYLVSFYAKAGTGAINDLTVRYSRDGGTNFVSCVDYNTQAITTSTWTKITCLFTTDSTTPTNADLIFTQATAPGGTRSIYIDALSVTLNTNNANNVQIGGANEGGPATLFTLDRASSAPIADNNNAYLGSMYYDTTTGRIQCYEADGWGACGSAPDNIVNLNPEYAGAVLNGTGIGTMTTDLCANQTSVLTVNTGLCAAGEAKNFYKWTSPQATQQTYSIYVSYQLPTTFKGFASDDTVQLTARVDSTSNAAVTYEMYRSESGTITQCGSGETAVTSSANTWQTVGINGNESTGCSFTASSGGAYVIFKINVKANSNANAYVSTLSFTTTGK